MDRITLREAAVRTSRSITTLRRYIRSGRLSATKQVGRFGPEYFVSEADLAHAGLDATVSEPPALPERRPEPGVLAPRRILPDAVPLTLFQDLQMKHEQLLVQYGMVRAGGLRVMELQSQLDTRRRQHEEALAELGRVRETLRSETERLERSLREARLELEGRAIEIAALQEKVKALELMTRNAVTTEAIEKQFSAVMEQSRKVERLAGGGAPRLPWRSVPTEPEATDH